MLREQRNADQGNTNSNKNKSRAKYFVENLKRSKEKKHVNVTDIIAKSPSGMSKYMFSVTSKFNTHRLLLK